MSLITHSVRAAFFVAAIALATQGAATLSAAPPKAPKTAAAPAAKPKPLSGIPKAESRNNDRSWAERQKILNQRAKEGGFDVMFIGDSITHYWEWHGKDVWAKRLAPYRPANFGIGGDQTGHVLWRLKNGNLSSKTNPKLIILLIGTNDTGHSHANIEAQRVASGVKAIITELQSRTRAKILLFAIFPRDISPEHPFRKKNEEINALIAKFADNNRVFYKDINKSFLDANGWGRKGVMRDREFLHPGEWGYNIWADALIPEIKTHLGPNYKPATEANAQPASPKQGGNSKPAKKTKV
ncbi:MAG: GDSL-type esterase/lipase family protein [Puniceicoccales bacterium]|jgi:lysophospholipase L1-like esterase|nr:GDSL-type esterase/lipase family protein [Puniceicoccales bacterium]